MDIEKASELIEEFKGHIGNSIFGQEVLVNEVLCAFLSEGHILMTGAPGLAKTTLVPEVTVTSEPLTIRTPFR